MREDPGLDVDGLSASIEEHYGPRVVSVTFLPLGYDPNAAVYEVVSRETTPHTSSRSASAPATSPACWCRGRS